MDYPEILINEHERTEMPFRYVVDAKGEPIMPDVSQSLCFVTFRNGSLAYQSLQGMVDLIKNDADKGVGDLF